MIWTCTDKIRQIINEPEWPLPMLKLPTDCKYNCLAAALSAPDDTIPWDELVSVMPEIPTPKFNDVFERLLNELDLKWRKISDISEAKSDEYVIQIYGFYRNPMGREYHPDFHLIRRELDGTWVHKPDWVEPPCEINFQEFLKEYPDNEIAGTYAVRKKAR